MFPIMFQRRASRRARPRGDTVEGMAIDASLCPGAELSPWGRPREGAGPRGRDGLARVSEHEPAERVSPHERALEQLLASPGITRAEFVDWIIGPGERSALAVRVHAAERAWVIGSPRTYTLPDDDDEDASARARPLADSVRRCDIVLTHDAFLELLDRLDEACSATREPGSPYRGHANQRPHLARALALLDAAATRAELVGTFGPATLAPGATRRPRIDRRELACAMIVIGGVVLALPQLWYIVLPALPMQMFALIMGVWRDGQDGEALSPIPEDMDALLLASDGRVLLDGARRGEPEPPRAFAADERSLRSRWAVERDRDFAHRHVIELAADEHAPLRLAGYLPPTYAPPARPACRHGEHVPIDHALTDRDTAHLLRFLEDHGHAHAAVEGGESLLALHR
ncbi:MAG: hypothetical protein H6713_24015 [Myxococcales bacterium]|nr:hypothetical protein [Myxococcales bacterium]